MSAVHAGKRPPPGRSIEVPIRALANGTLAEAGQAQDQGNGSRRPRRHRHLRRRRPRSARLHGLQPGHLGCSSTSRPTRPGPRRNCRRSAPTRASPSKSKLRRRPCPPRNPSPAPAAGCQPDPTQAAAPAIVPGGFSGRADQRRRRPLHLERLRGHRRRRMRGNRPAADLRRRHPRVGQGPALHGPGGDQDDRARGRRLGPRQRRDRRRRTLSLTGLASDERLKGADDAALAQGDLVPAKGAK